MRWRKAAFVTLPALWTFIPLYAVEQAANYYYLADNPAVFFTISGWRLPLFIIIAVVGSVMAGALTKDLWGAALGELVGLFFSFLTFYSVCDPRVCFSTGMDGLEPLRMGFFLAAVVISGAALGMSSRGRAPGKSGQILVSYCAFVAVAFYPVTFTFAGTRILWDLHPWAVLAALGAAAFSVSAGLAARAGRIRGLMVPLAGLLTLFLIAYGIASAYIDTLGGLVGLMACATLLASGCGVALSSSVRRGSPGARRGVSAAYALALVLVLGFMLVAVPDAVSAVVPQSQGSQSEFTIGTPVYAGAYMDAPPGHASGAGVTVTFNESSASAIQADNFLSAGLGVHAAGCCVDGIDYAYRFDIYLYHDGSRSLAASAWEICDDNAACGGHSWKSLIFLHTAPLQMSASGQNVTLRVSWLPSVPGVVAWNYSVSNGQAVLFASFRAPPAENRNFNTGLLEGGTLGPQQSGSYFFQVGVMSSRPILHGGWRVALSCPMLLTSEWTCVQHARTLQGDQSFWKVFWRWGEEYPAVSVSSSDSSTVIFEYAQESARNFQSLW